MFLGFPDFSETKWAPSISIQMLNEKLRINYGYFGSGENPTLHERRVIQISNDTMGGCLNGGG
jgi:hypothetical protein